MKKSAMTLSNYLIPPDQLITQELSHRVFEHKHHFGTLLLIVTKSQLHKSAHRFDKCKNDLMTQNFKPQTLFNLVHYKKQALTIAEPNLGQ